MSDPHFENAMLQRLASTLNVPYDQLVRHIYPDYSSPHFRAASALIHRAARSKYGRGRGWQRKLKRARRIQREASSWSVSNAWFTMQWEWACERERRIGDAAINAMLSVYIDPQ